MYNYLLDTFITAADCGRACAIQKLGFRYAASHRLEDIVK